MPKFLFAITSVMVFSFLVSNNAVAKDTVHLIDMHSMQFETKHGAQGTGNYKGKRDRHEKATPQNEKKKKSSNWLPLRK